MAILAYDDVMLREPRLLVPGMVPVGNVRVDWNNIAKWLDYVFIFGAFQDGVVMGRPGLEKITYTRITGATIGSAQNGRCLLLDGTSNNGATLSKQIFSTSVCSIFWGDYGQAITDSDGGAITTSGNNYSNGLQIRINDDGSIYIIKQNTSISLSTICRKSNAFNGCGVTIAGDNARHAIFCNGSLRASSTPTVTYSHNDVSYIGDQGFSGGYVTLNGPLYYLYFSARCVPDAVAAELTRDPFQILTVA